MKIYEFQTPISCTWNLKHGEMNCSFLRDAVVRVDALICAVFSAVPFKCKRYSKPKNTGTFEEGYCLSRTTQTSFKF